MTVYFHLTPKGLTKLPDIQRLLNRAGVREKLRQLGNGQAIEVTYPRNSRFHPELMTGVDEALARLGVGFIHKTDGPDEIRFTHGPSVTLQEINQMIAGLDPADPPKALLHLIQTLYFPGMPRDTLSDLKDRVKPVDVTVTATGIASARGVAATGNLGAVNHLQIFGRIFDAAVSVLNGGQGTRLFGLRKLKGDIAFGNNNLTIWNILTALYFRSQMPESGSAEATFGSYHVTLANDGILVPFGVLTSGGEVLKTLPKEKAKEGYFFVSPDDPAAMSEKDTQRFGMVALAKDGSFICATEKAGREKTFAEAQAVMAARGQQVEKEEIRLYINYFGMATTRKLEKALEEALKTLFRPDLTADQMGDLDTYGLLFAVLSSSRAEELRAGIKTMGLNNLIIEAVTDKVLFKRLEAALFIMDNEGKKRIVPRFGFAEFNRGAISLDIGTLPSLYGLYLDMVRTFDLEGKTRDKLLGYRRILERGGNLSVEQLREFDELQTIMASEERAVRATSQRIAGFDPAKVIEGCEFEIDPLNPPIIGVATDDYTLPPQLQDAGEGADVMRQVQEIVSAKSRPQLAEYRDASGKLLFLYDPKGINTVKLAGSRIKSGAVIGRNTLVLNSEIGNGTDTVIVAENGAVVASRVAGSVTHKQAEPVNQLALTEALKSIARAGKGKYSLPLPNGWNAVFTLTATEQSEALAGQLQQQADRAKANEDRRIADINQFLGIVDPSKNVTLDMNEGIGRIDISGNGLTGKATDPSKVFHFSLHFEKRAQPSYIVYGRNQSGQLVVDKPTAYSSKQPVANAPAMDYEVPFDADPSKTRLAFYGGIVMKDPRMQEEFGYYTRFRMLNNAELIQKNTLLISLGRPGLFAEMAADVNALIQQLPSILDLPRNGDPLPSINVARMAAVIENAVTPPGQNLKQAIIHELIHQTPDILSQFIQRATGADLDNASVQIETSRDAVGRNGYNFRSNISNLLNALEIEDRSARRRLAEDIIRDYPLSEVIFNDTRTTIETFAYDVEALIEQYRMVEVPLFDRLTEVPQRSSLVDFALDLSMAANLAVGAAPIPL